MAWIKVEDFTNYLDWEKESDTHDYYDVSYTDIPEYTSTGSKESSLRVDFNTNSFIESYISKIYTDPFFFKFQDKVDKEFRYDTLVFTYKFETNNMRFDGLYKRPTDFYFTLSLLYKNEQLREWFVPVKASGCCYNRELFDLRPLIDIGYDRFDEVRISFIKAQDWETSFYFGDLYLMQDDSIHNTAVAIASMLHMKQRKLITATNQHSKTGSSNINLNSLTDIYKGSTIIIGGPDSDYCEIHCLSEVPVDDGKNSVKFTNHYDGSHTLTDWPAGTPVHTDYPALYGDVSSFQSAIPSYYIVTEAPAPDEETTPMGFVRSSFVRDPNGNHTCGYHKARDSIKIPVTVHVWAVTPEQADDLYRYLRSALDSQSFIPACGNSYDYEIVSYRNPPSDNALDLPAYVVDMLVYTDENVHEIKYVNFTGIKRLTISGGSYNVADTNNRIPVEVDITYGA